jgi:chromosome partitioning protein
VKEANIGIAMGLSHVAARNEVRALVSAIKLPPAKLRLVA